ncbi:MAG: HAD hydrolase family protein [Myxococcales bacterium]
MRRFPSVRFVAFATDYDETLAGKGVVEPRTLAALEHVKSSGRKLLLVTGRDLDDLVQVFPEHAVFDAIVAENGALLYVPSTKKEKKLAETPPPGFAQSLRRHGATPLTVGRVIVATRVPYETLVIEEIRRLGLELQIIFNKGAVMVLPAGVHKGTGLKLALAEMKLSPHNVVGVGDAENDHAFLAECECGVAVGNALPALKDRADLVMKGHAEDGVLELLEQLVKDDLRSALSGRPGRRDILLGETFQGARVAIPPAAGPLLFAGSTESGKSTAVKGFVERLLDADYQCCVFDPEGDWVAFERTVQLGDPKRAPTVDEVVHALSQPDEQIVVNLVAVPFDDRGRFCSALLSRLADLRARSGRPHFIVLDEAHHLVPPASRPSQDVLPQDLSGVVLVTLAPQNLARPLLEQLEMVVSVGVDAGKTAAEFRKAVGLPAKASSRTLERGEALLWRRGSGDEVPIRLARTNARHHRHARKYAEGDLGPERSFYFRGAEKKLNLRAPNLVQFGELAAGVDDDTWLHHLRQGDYSKWFRTEVKDEELARDAELVERDGALDAKQSREKIRAAIAQRYTLPAQP